MARFNQKTTTPPRRTPDTKTYEGHAAYSAPTDKEALFNLAVTNFVGRDTFYESAKNRDDRYAELVGKVALADPAWMLKFIHFLRNTANMRTASVVAAVEAAMARVKAGAPSKVTEHGQSWAAQFVLVACVRADEPGELVGYFWSKYGTNPAKMPNGIKRGLELAASVQYNQFNTLKYDTDKAAVRFADVIALAHARPVGDEQKALFPYLVANRQHVPNVELPAELEMMQARAELYALPEDERRNAVLDNPDRLKAAGMTWEALAGWGQGPMDAEMWDLMIPQMGYMALLRNLRNFDKAGISRRSVTQVKQRLADPDQVARSRQLPYRFLSAYKAVESDRWREPLGDALDASLVNIPELEGRTLVLVDVSGSMSAPVSGYQRGGRGPYSSPGTRESSMSLAEAGALFGVALAAKNGSADLVGFATDTFVHRVPKGASVLRQVDAFTRKIGSIGYGTEMARALTRHYDGHDRVIIVSDMQAFQPGWGVRNVQDVVPANVPMYAFDMTGYEGSPLDTERPNRHQFGGLTDHVFRMLAMWEAGVGQVEEAFTI